LQASKYQIWLTFNGETEKFRFPVLPETLNIKNGSGNKSVDIQGLGEVTIKQDPKAIIISWSGVFPYAYFPGVAYLPLPNPTEAADRLVKWKNSDIPVHLVITGTKLSMYCTVEDFSVSEQGGDVGTVYYSITLKEYKEVHARQVKIRDDTAIVDDSPARTDNRAPERTHTVVKGDCLWNIAKKHLGNASRWTEIYDLNRDIIRNPNLIYPGQVLKLPS